LSDGFKTCAEAENGKEAIEVAKQFKPDVITLDLSMPVMNGLTAASEVRRVFPRTPIILLTLYGNSLPKTAASRAGVNRVLPKTVRLSTLIDSAHELMGNSVWPSSKIAERGEELRDSKHASSCPLGVNPSPKRDVCFIRLRSLAELNR